MSDDLLQRLRVHGAVPAHVAIIMDGNGRWAEGRSLPRPLGHHAGMTRGARGGRGVPRGRGRGAHPVRLQPGELAAPRGRDRGAHEPPGGVHRAGDARAAGSGGGGPHPGRPRPAGAGAREAVERIVAETAGGGRLALNLCISYGSRAEIVRAARLLAEDVAAGRLDPARDRRGGARAAALHRGVARSRSPHPHLGRDADLQLPPLAAGVRRALRHPGALARLHPPTPLRGHSRVPAARPPVRARLRPDGRPSWCDASGSRRSRSRSHCWWSGTAVCRSRRWSRSPAALGTAELFDLAERAGIRPARASGSRARPPCRC